MRDAAFIDTDVERAAAVCVLGETVASNLFGIADPVGAVIRLKGIPLKVLGVMQHKGFSTTGQNQDNFLVLPITTAQKRVTGADWIDDIHFSAASRENIPEAVKRIVRFYASGTTCERTRTMTSTSARPRIHHALRRTRQAVPLTAGRLRQGA